MKIAPALFFSLLLVTVNIQANELHEYDYCYKPEQPLFFSTQQTKNNYQEDLQEYHRCQQRFAEMQTRVNNMKQESEANRQHILNSFVGKQ